MFVEDHNNARVFCRVRSSELWKKKIIFSFLTIFLCADSTRDFGQTGYNDFLFQKWFLLSHDKLQTKEMRNVDNFYTILLCFNSVCVLLTLRHIWHADTLLK